jgi:hypothetical protein
MSAKKRQQTMAKFMREQAVREKRMLKRQRKEEAAAAARIAKAEGLSAPEADESTEEPVEAHADRS